MMRSALDQAEEYGGNQLEGPQREPQHDQHAEDSRQRIAQRAIADHGKLVVVHRHLDGQADTGAEVLEACCCLFDAVGRSKPGLQGAEIKPGCDLDKMPRLVGGEIMALQ